ncbi:hypothetical protein CVIRNUC_003394 [Coccomyxa viridis]|uniref:Protein kinase domain-containing protein n=1 Tax=Coccomyxa viridis TaxID=1274662 RepID=A0AAV1HZM1_9CHLO|nr:hypothetical protein CVIRNUC_003394 [Coccomyxa viridis]
MIPSIQGLSVPGLNKGQVAAIIEDVLEDDTHCTIVIGEGKFGRVEDRSTRLASQSVPARGGEILFDNLVIKTIDLRGKQPQCKLADTQDGVMVTSDPKRGGVVHEVIANCVCTELFLSKSPHFVFMAGIGNCTADGTFEMYFENLVNRAERRVSSTQTEVEHISNLEQLMMFWQKTRHVITDDTVDALLLGVLHALHVMRKRCSMSHCDLHVQNVYIKAITDEPYFMGEVVTNYQWLCYHVQNQEFYVRMPGFFAKIGDMGYSRLRLGTTSFTNRYADTVRNIEKWQPYIVANGGEYPDHLHFIGEIINRFSRHYTCFDRLRERVYPLNELNGMQMMDVFEDGVDFDSLRCPNLAAVLLHLGVFDHLKRRPTSGKVLHIHD